MASEAEVMLGRIGTITDAYARDFHRHGELLGTLSEPRNRKAIEAGSNATIAELFDLVDRWKRAHEEEQLVIRKASEGGK